jgi:hypothetical protein
MANPGLFGSSTISCGLSTPLKSEFESDVCFDSNLLTTLRYMRGISS